MGIGAVLLALLDFFRGVQRCTCGGELIDEGPRYRCKSCGKEYDVTVDY